jgi:hypothetical protein
MRDHKFEVDQEDIDKLIIAGIRLEEEGDVDGAESLYKIGTSLGDFVCMTRLADMLSEPPEFKNIPLAEELYKKACVAGKASACRNLAIMYKQLGKSVLHDKYMKYAKSRGDVWQLDDQGGDS